MSRKIKYAYLRVIGTHTHTFAGPIDSSELDLTCNYENRKRQI